MIDHSTTNPKLHALHVRWHYEVLRVMRDARDELHGMSMVSASIAAGEINQRMDAFIREEASFRDAAALLFTGQEPPRDEEEEDSGVAEAVSEG